MSPSSLPATPHVARSRDLAVLDVFGVSVNSLAGAAETAGACSASRVVCPPRAGAPFHRHAQAENFYVIRGQLAVRLGDALIEAGPGDFVHVPPHLPHTFTNNSESDAEFLTFGTPGGHELFFRDADALARSGGFTPASAAAVCGQHGIELLP